jgi:hypothetical protein
LLGLNPLQLTGERSRLGLQVCLNVNHQSMLLFSEPNRMSSYNIDPVACHLATVFFGNSSPMISKTQIIPRALLSDNGWFVLRNQRATFMWRITASTLTHSHNHYGASRPYHRGFPVHGSDRVTVGSIDAKHAPRRVTFTCGSWTLPIKIHSREAHVLEG